MSQLPAPEPSPGQPARLGDAASLIEVNQALSRSLDAPNWGSEAPAGPMLRSARLRLGLTAAELASRSCLSVAQLEQLEEGGHSLFYSVAIRELAARRVATVLGLSGDLPPQPKPARAQAAVDPVATETDGITAAWWRRWLRR